MKSNKFYFGILLLIFLFGSVSASYATSSVQFTQPGIGSSFLGSGTTSEVNFNSEICISGQDFIIRIVPGGCTPPVVRSDLLEEQNVPVYCKLQALKVNPLITVSSIDSISFGGTYPEGISTVAFVPSYPALGLDRQLSNGAWENIGYAVIFLKRNANESSMPEFLAGGLSATIRYSLRDSFGLENYKFYLPLMTDSEFSELQGQYAFFNHMGYLRADDIQSNSASISIYSGLNSNQNGIEKQKILSRNLDVGEESSSFFLPGFGCLASSSFKLDAVQGQETRAVLKVNSEIFEVTNGEFFYDGKCQVVSDPLREGLRETVQVRCAGDDKSQTFGLAIEPTITLSINSGVEKTYHVGDPLGYSFDEKTIYLGYVGTDPKSKADTLRNSLIYLVTVPGEPLEKLDQDTLSKVAKYAKNDLRNDKTASDYLKSLFGLLSTSFDWLFDGNNFKRINYGPAEEAFGRRVQIKSFGIGTNLDLKNQTLIGYKNNAVRDYIQIQQNFANEKYPEEDSTPLGENALLQLINLSNVLNQKEDLKKYCDEFKTKYPNSDLDYSPCEGLPKYSNVGVSSQIILMDGDYKEVSLEGIREPSFEDYGIEVMVRKGDKTINSPIKLAKGETVYLDSFFSTSGKTNSNKEFIKLNEIKDEEYANLDFSLQNRSVLSTAGSFLTSPSRTLEKEIPFNVDGTDYTFVITRINLKKVAKVSIHTSFRDLSHIDFNFTVGIEKRSIQLSPEETRSRIEKLNNLLNTLQGISENLESTIKTFQTTCEIAGAILTAKNLLFNSGTDSIARKTVMNGEKGWNSQCESLKVGTKTYSTKDQCLFDNSDQIENEVKQVSEEMDRQTKSFETLEAIDGVTTSGGLFGQDKVNQNVLMDKGYAEKIKLSLSGFGSTFKNPDGGVEIVDLQKVVVSFTGENLGKLYSLEDAKQIELYANLASKYPEDSTYKKRLFTLLYGVQKNYDNTLRIVEAAKKDSISEGDISVLEVGKDIKSIPYSGRTVANFKNLGFSKKHSAETPVQKIISTQGNIYYAILEEKVQGQFYIQKNEAELLVVYSEDGSSIISKENLPKEFYQIYFKKADVSEGTPIKNPEIKYYETDPYKGLPALVPIDSDKGWYAYIPQIVSTSSSSKTYDLSGRVNSFWVCNAGSDGVMEYNPMNDACQLINLGNVNTYSNIGTLSSSDSIKLVNIAVKNIQTVSTAYKDGIKNIKLDGKTYNIGVPEVDTPTVECTDVMSPSECKILFNACDPVICPSSRCNYGGEYTVQNVVQSGVVGSVMLCLPNWNEGIYVPVCLTGVKAGVDNFMSVAKSYRECLNTSLVTGSTTGICDEINSIYMCEFFWRQALPILNLAVPKIDSLIFGGGAKGGGEYVGGIQGALQNAKNSADYLVQYYSLNANSAFKAKSQEEVGSLVCKNFLSVVYPQGQGALDALTQSRSPPQFTAKFDVIPFSSVTNPPQVQYKVFYHIFAGNDQGAYYRVYLKGDGSSYYSDASYSLAVDSGYIPPGEYETNTKDFTASEGYKQLCVQVNNQEECGFGTVSTDFVINYLGDQYVKDQAIMNNITSQSECISGTPNLISLLNPNLEAGISNAASPEIVNEGVTRICATENPGKNNDLSYPGLNQRWVDVGYCDNINMRCWIDRQSLSAQEVFNFQISEDQTLESLGDLLKENLANQNGMLNENQFLSKLNEIFNESNPFKKIDLLEKIYDKVLESNKKGYLLFIRGGIYQGLTIDLYHLLFDKIPQGSACNSPNSCFLVDTVQCEGDSYNSFDCMEGYLCCLGGKVSIKTVSGEKDFTSSKYRYIKKNYFVVDFLSKDSDFCYQFQSGAWKWSESCEDSSTSIVAGSNPKTSTVQYTWKSFEESLPSEIISLKDANSFLEGLKILIEATINPSSEISLSAGTIKLDNSGIFTVGSANNLLQMFVKYEKEWLFSRTIDGVWSSASFAQNYKTEQSMNGLPLTTISKLEGKTLIEGASDLFENKIFDNFIPKINWVGDSLCSKYYLDIQKYSIQYEIDPALVLATMYQESKCDSSAQSPSSFGLMQIRADSKGWCGKYGLSSDLKTCQNTLLTNPSKNIEVGIQILVSYFGSYKNGIKNSNVYKTDSAFKSLVDNCISSNPKYGNYIDYSAALRGYNGWGCGSGADIDYVEKVVKIWNELKSAGAFKTVSTPEAPAISNSLMGEKILNEANSLVGENTFRIQNGDTVYDRVCATFVSKVLIAAGALPEFKECPAESTPEVQSVQKLNNEILPKNNFVSLDQSQWKSELKPGDVIIWGCQPLKGNGGASYCNSKEFQHVTIFADYSSGTNYQVVHDGGASTNIEKKVYQNNEDWYITHVWRSTLDQTIVNKTVSSPVLSSKIWNLSSALEKVKTLRGSYIDNFQFVDEIYSDNLITETQYKDIIGGQNVWSRLFNWQEDMNYVQNILEENYVKAGYDLGKIQDLNKVKEEYLSYLNNYRVVNPETGEENFENFEKAFEMVKENNNLINLTDKEGVTILYLFALHDCREFSKMSYLVLRGAEVNTESKYGSTILHWIADRCETDAANLLLSHGANINAKDNEGLTPLHYSVFNYGMVKLLVDKGAEINTKDTEGVTPLMDAVGWGSYEIVNYLISKGADINVKDNGGKGLIQYLNEREEDSDKIKIKNLLNSKGLK